jgi:tripartite-type tricarboxylate transporter receptor subunit TctC
MPRRIQARSISTRPGSAPSAMSAANATAAGIKLTHIPYKGTGPALTDLLGGHIPMAFAPIPATHESANSGLLRMLAVTSLTRSALMPEIATMHGLGGMPRIAGMLPRATI